MKKIIFFLNLISAGLLFGQHFSLKNEEKKAFAFEAERLLSALAHDSMEGREAGSKAEKKAAQFIRSYLETHHIIPYFNTYEDTFLIYKHPSVRKATLNIGKQIFTYPDDFTFYFAAQSDQGSLIPISNTTIDEEKIEKCALITFCPFSLNTHQDSTVFYSHVDKILQKIQFTNGQTYIFTVNNNCEGALPADFVSAHFSRKNIIVATSSRFINFLNTIKDSIFFDLQIEFNTDTFAISTNLLAWIDNKASSTIVLGAHFDHLGYGLQNSRYIGPQKIHNGADDNGSGTVFLMMLAKYLNEHRYLFNHHNYLIAFFSGEEKGLLGSKHITEKHLTFKPMAMLNFDMVGRFDSIQRPLYILGTATSPQWDNFLPPSPFIKKVPNGIRGSDQYSFYAKQIPVLFFFTGMHADYHTPYDDVEKINFSGMVKTMEYTLQLLNALQSVDQLTFQAIQEDTTSRHGYAKFTLGIVPDFSWNGKGVQVEEVIPGKLAQRMGIQKNDIIVQLNETKIENIYQYMKALQKISTEHENSVHILRNGEELKLTFRVN